MNTLSGCFGALCQPEYSYVGDHETNAVETACICTPADAKQLSPPATSEELDTDIFHAATETPISHPAVASTSETEAQSVGGSDSKARKHWRVAAAALSLARAAQVAQTQHAEQNLSDWATSFKRKESEAGHGPFAGVPLEPKEGMHNISILVRLRR